MVGFFLMPHVKSMQHRAETLLENYYTHNFKGVAIIEEFLSIHWHTTCKRNDCRKSYREVHFHEYFEQHKN